MNYIKPVDLTTVSPCSKVLLQQIKLFEKGMKEKLSVNDIDRSHRLGKNTKQK